MTSKSAWDGRISPSVTFGPRSLVVMAGPCMLESLELGLRVGSELRRICENLGMPYVFKSSFDKANRTSPGSPRGPGLELGLRWLETIRKELGVPVLTDVHTPAQVSAAAAVCDVLQIPAFLSEQRDLLTAAAQSGKPVQIKKGQHLCAEDAVAAARFVEMQGNPRVLLCERGTTFGYGDLVVDMRNLVEMRASSFLVVFDGTHSAQLPGAGKGVTAGLRGMVRPLVRAAVATGVDGLFLEVHPDPERALSDAATQVNIEEAALILREAHALASVTGGGL